MPLDIADLPAYLNGLRSATSWALLALHSINALEVRDGRIVGNGPAMMDVIRHPGYWERQGRVVPDYLWEFRDLAFRDPELTGQVVGDAENTIMGTMVGRAWEYVVQSINRDRLRRERIMARLWTPCARIVRNAAFHGGTVLPVDGIDFPFTWRDLTFTREMIHQPLQVIGFFDMPHAFQLIADMHADAQRDFRDEA